MLIQTLECSCPPDPVGMEGEYAIFQTGPHRVAGHGRDHDEVFPGQDGKDDDEEEEGVAPHKVYEVSDNEDEDENEDGSEDEDAGTPSASTAPLSSTTASRKRLQEATEFWNQHLPAMARCNKPRKVPRLAPSLAGSKRSQGQRRDDVSASLVASRIAQYPKEGFIIHNNNIVCSGCHTNVTSAKNGLLRHINSKKHQEGKLKAAKVQSNRDSLVASIKV